MKMYMAVALAFILVTSVGCSKGEAMTVISPKVIDRVIEAEQIRILSIENAKTVFEKGDKNEEIKDIKYKLDKLNFISDHTDVFNDKLEEVIERYQIENKFNVNGKVIDTALLENLEKTYSERKVDTNADLNELVLVNKNYFLSEDYIPANMVKPKIDLVIGDTKMLPEAANAIEKMFDEAKVEGIVLMGRSGFRSYNTQKSIFEGHVKKRGFEEANKISARPGQSEHQTGLAIDITAESVNRQLKESFKDTKEGIWVSDNAYKYGYIIRFAEDKTDITGYSYEPWHIRYVGKEAAKEIYEKNLTLEEYLGKN